MRIVVIEIVAEIGTDQQQRIVPPQRTQYRRGDIGGDVSHQQRHQLEMAQHFLQERQLHFDAMLIAVRGVAAKLLRARGYEVIEAASGEEALEIAEENAARST